MASETKASEQVAGTDDIADLTEATLQYQRYVELQLLAEANEQRAPDPRRADWTHPIGLVMAC